MADVPTARSYQQILNDMLDAFLSKQGIRALRVGGPILSMLEASARSDFRSSKDVFDALTTNDLDNATGLALQRKGDDEKVPKITQGPATGKVNISDTSFTKRSTKLFLGAPAPIVGSTTLSVVDASSFPAAGQVYVGRGTLDYEGPLTYSSKSNVGNHWNLVLTGGTSKFHNTSENVVVAQGGNRVVGASTVVRTPQGNVSNAIEFRTLYSVTVPDGEDSFPNVDVVAQVPGKGGNVIAGAIKEFSNPPFTGAAVTNPGPFINGVETELDDDYRERIRAAKASRQMGTKLAIETAVTGITAPDENRRVNSASLVKRFGFPSTLYIDDGTGYEEKTAAVAIEVLMDSATGGEPQFQATQRPIARGFAVTKNSAPYVLRSTDQLSVRVGGVLHTHVFKDTDFRSISGASAFEVVASVNANPDAGFVARTADSASKVVIFANSDTNEDIEVVTAVDGTDANDALGLPSGVNYTMRLFKNDRLLMKDGVVAALTGLPFAQWNAITGTQTLELSIDNTPSLVFSFVDQDFIDSETSFATVGRNSIAAWAAAINAKIPGITATENSGRLVLTSNAGPVAKAAVEVVGGTLVTAHFFPVDRAQGAERDYVLDRNAAQVTLMKVLAAGDRLSAGSLATRSFVESSPIGTVNLGSEADLWFVVDGSAQIIPHGVTPATPLDVTVAAAHDFGHTIVIDTGASASFANVQADDWVITWDPAIPASLRGVFRVVNANDTQVYIERHSTPSLRAGHKSVTLDPGVSANPAPILTCGGGTLLRASMAHLSPPAGILNTAEKYDHSTKTSSAVAPMNTARSFHTATLLPSGKVAVVGGMGDGGVMHKTIEVYDPVADTWTMQASQLTTGVRYHTATLLTDGRVLIAGGDTGTQGHNKFQIWTPGADTITAPGTLISARGRHCAVKLPSNQVLIVGGFDATNTDVATAELFTPGIDSCAGTGAMTRARSGFGMASVGLAPTKVIAIGNRFGATGKATYEEYNIAGATWGAETAIPNLVNFEDKDVTKITNGNVVGLNGWNTISHPSEAGFVYDGTTFLGPAEDPLYGDTSARWDGAYAEVKNGTGTIKNFIACISGDYNHSTPWAFQSTGIIEVYDTINDTWEIPEPAVSGGLLLLSTGITFVRSNGFVQEVTIPSGANYTASSLIDAMNQDLRGAAATTYRTSALRVNTNSYMAGGDVALVSQNTAAQGLQLSPDSAVENLAPHVGSVQSFGSDLGTPSFEDVRVVSRSKGVALDRVVVTSSTIGADYTIVGLRNWYRGADGSSTFDGPDPYLNFRANSNFKFRTPLVASTAGTLLTVAEPRLASPEPWGAFDRAYMASPYAMGPNADLSVIVDDDLDKQFAVKMYRDLITVGNTYAITNTFREVTNDSLSTTFGLDFDFEDCAVFMSSRAVIESVANKQMLWRYFRLGPDGDGVRARFGNPLAPNSNLAVTTALDTTGHTNMTVRLRSGAPRNVTAHASTRVGRAITNVTAGGTGTWIYILNLLISSASRTTNVTTLTLTLPPGVAAHAIPNGSNIWVNSTNGSFSSGLKTITGVTANTVTYTETDVDIGATANIGTVSFDNQAEATYAGAGVIAKDFIRLVDPTNTVSFANATYQVVTATNQYVTAFTGDAIDTTGFSPSSVLWIPIAQAENLQVFANSAQTAAAISAAITAARGVASSTCPIDSTLLGSGAGTIDQNTPDALDSNAFWYTLSDGVNWVKTTIKPLVLADDYQLTFKNPVNGTLSTGADWVDEKVRVVPITTRGIVEWLNAPTVTGLFTDAAVEASDDGSRVQIATRTPGSDGGVQVQGGLANVYTAPVVGSPVALGASHSASTIAITDGEGLSKGMWAQINNTIQLPKLAILHTTVQLQSWTADGYMLFDQNVVDVVVAPVQSKVQFERQGAFVAISDMGAGSSFSFANVVPGSWIRISEAAAPTLPQVSAANQGIFRVLRVAPSASGSAGTIFIENSGVFEEFSECTVGVYGPNSAVPGDQLVVLSDIWGVENQGTWTIRAVGATSPTSQDDYSNTVSFVVDVSERVPVPVQAAAPLNATTSRLIYVLEGTPGVFVMRIDGVSLNQDDGDFLDLRWDRAIGASSISASAGSIISILDKLGFSTDFASGADGYRYDVGLIREANRVVYGDPADPVTYPGVAAADSHINTQGSVVRRIQVVLSIRIQTNLTLQDIANRVRSAVATVINQTPTGRPISFSSIVSAAEKVTGVGSVAIVSPRYDVAHDQIVVQPHEKPFVIDLLQDVQVNFLST